MIGEIRQIDTGSVRHKRTISACYSNRRPGLQNIHLCGDDSSLYLTMVLVAYVPPVADEGGSGIMYYSAIY